MWSYQPFLDLKVKTESGRAKDITGLRMLWPTLQLKFYMSFVINVAYNFKEFVMPLQSAEPKIHILHNKCRKLIKWKIYDSKVTLLNTGELLKVIKNKENHTLSFKFLLWLISETFKHSQKFIGTLWHFTLFTLVTSKVVHIEVTQNIVTANRGGRIIL